MPYIERKILGAQFVEVVCTHPSAVGFGKGVHGAAHPRAVSVRSVNVVHDWVGVEGLELFQSPRVRGCFEHAEHLFDKRQHRSFMHGQAHGHVQSVGAWRQGLKQGSQCAPVRKHHQGLVELIWRQVGEDVSDMLGLEHSGCATHRTNLGRLAGKCALDKWCLRASEFADEQPSFVVDVVHVRGVGVPEHGQSVGLAPGVETSPFGRAHGGQTCGKHVVHVQMSFPFREPPGQVGTGGQAILPQAGMQLGIQFRQPPPLAFEGFLIFRPCLFPEAPVFDALDVGQVLEHISDLGQFVVHGGKIVEHHLGPRHKPVKWKDILGRAHHTMQPHQDFQGICRRPW